MHLLSDPAMFYGPSGERLYLKTVNMDVNGLVQEVQRVMHPCDSYTHKVTCDCSKKKQPMDAPAQSTLEDACNQLTGMREFSNGMRAGSFKTFGLDMYFDNIDKSVANYQFMLELVIHPYYRKSANTCPDAFVKNNIRHLEKILPKK